MKKLLTLAMIVLFAASCSKLEDLNTNTKDPQQVPGESLYTGAQLNLFNQMVTPDYNYNVWRLYVQQWTQTTYVDESNYDLIDRSIPDHHWNRMYHDVLKNLDEAAKVIRSTTYLSDPDPAVKENKLLISEVLTVYAWSVLVETFGNIPYSQALDINNLLPAYDDGLTVYKDLIIRLDSSLQHLNPSYGSFSDGEDNMYRGDVASWRRFANSLKLRMGMLLADCDPGFAKTVVEQAAADPAGLIASNAQNAALVYLSAPPHTNPIYDALVLSGRHDLVPAATLVDTMNALSDPRMPWYFTLTDTSATGTPTFVYLGGTPGESNDYYRCSHVSEKIAAATFEGLILDCAETEFLLAEAVERGFSVGGTAAEHYNKAVRASIIYWGGLDAEAEVYLADPRVAYASAPGDFKRKIGFQKWLALYNRGFESWTEWRRLDFPILTAPPSAVSATPLRFTYPVSEQTLNGAQYEAAAAAIGGDNVTTKLFWDKH